MNTLNKDKLRQLAAEAHHLNPVVIVGQNGLTENVVNEVDQALKAHELIKIKINEAEKSDRLAITEEICNQLDAAFVKHIGRISIVYRKSQD